MDIVKQWREKSGLTQTEAAKKMRLNIGFWSRIEAGKVELPPSRYAKASELFGVPIESFIRARVKKFAHALIGQVDKAIDLRFDFQTNGH